jgi:putative phosphoesterase
MRIAICSDIHDNLPNLGTFLKWCAQEGVEKVICCGDVTNGETLEALAKGFSGQIFLVRGNADLYEEEALLAYDNVVDGGRKAIFDISGKKVGVCHEPFLIKEVLALGRPDIIFYGHTHKPWLEDKDEAALINPGALSGGYTAATFAGWDTEKGWPELKILDLLNEKKF